MDPNSATKHGLSVGNSSACDSNQQKSQLSDSMLTNCTSFKQFDIVVDYSDHHFANQAKEVKKTSKDWTKKIQQDWNFLEKNLPETIFVRVYEGRMDLLRAVMTGPPGTPYHDGLFFFDFHFPVNYPHDPPKAYYHSGGLRLNPNLYEDGTVCLSLLNTWYGKGCEKWNPKDSNMLQVLVSIQALVLNAEPYFNEPPGPDSIANTYWEKKDSLAYNETAFLLSCKTMVYVLRKPPKNFEHFVAVHFREHGRAILLASKAYMNGTQIGYFDEESGKHDDECSEGHEDFRAKLNEQFEVLLKLFSVKGVDCKDFLAQNVKEADSKETLTRRVGDSSGAPKAAVNCKKIRAQQATVGNASNTLASGSKVSLDKALDAFATSKPADSLLKHLNQYMPKLGKKVLPVEK